MIEYKGIIIRAPEPEDLNTLYIWENDPEIWHLSNRNTPVSKYILRQFVEKAGENIFETGQQRFMICTGKADHPVGAADLFNLDAFHQRAGIGVLIADKKLRNKGLATKALEFIMDYGFRQLKLHQLYSNVLEENIESIALFRKLGFTETGKRTDWVRTSDGFSDEIIFQLINTARLLFTQ